MNFGESVSTCFRKYADFNGCASRPEFWWWVLFTFIATGVLNALNYRLSAAFSVATFLPSIAVGARRLHDTDRSGWLQLLGIIPIVGWIILIIWLAQEPKTPNRFAQAQPGV
jgi:uncharacterized membrane protein YhaH (DUF805 family)